MKTAVQILIEQLEGTLYYEIPEEKTIKIYTVDFNYKKELE